LIFVKISNKLFHYWLTAFENYTCSVHIKEWQCYWTISCLFNIKIPRAVHADCLIRCFLVSFIWVKVFLVLREMFRFYVCMLQMKCCWDLDTLAMIEGMDCVILYQWTYTVVQFSLLAEEEELPRRCCKGGTMTGGINTQAPLVAGISIYSPPLLQLLTL
jgi:hypothetical protein